MLEILLIICVLLLAVIIIYLISIFNKKEHAGKSETLKEKKFYNIEQTKNSSNEVDVVLTVDGRDFFFSHSADSTKEIKEMSKVIRESLLILENSKYKDIIDSRVEQIHGKLKKLAEISTIDKEKVAHIKKIIADYGERVKESL